MHNLPETAYFRSDLLLASLQEQTTKIEIESNLALANTLLEREPALPIEAQFILPEADDSPIINLEPQICQIKH